MYSKKILFVIPVMICTVLAGVIYIDSLERSVIHDDNPELNHHNERSHVSEPEKEDLERILSIEQQLEDINNDKLAIAFYGELIQIYMNNDRLDGAAEAAERMAGLTNDFQDWKNAGDWYHEWLLKESDQDYIRYFSERTINMYENALKVDPSHADVRTDLAIEYMRMGQADEAIRHLEEALSIKPDLLSANYNLGVILYQKGNKDKSISYLKRSLELAEGTDHENTVRDFLQQNEMQIL